MTEEKGIYKALLDVMGGIGAIGKDRTNTGQGYKFRGIDDVYNALNPLMVKHRVFCIPRVTSVAREDRTSSSGKGLIYTMLEVDYDFYAADGSFLSAHVAGEGMDSGDKSLNKAMSAAHKYALLQIFCIPTEEGELKDSEDDSHELGNQAKGEGPLGQVPPKTVPPKETTEAKTCPECGKPMKLRKPRAGGDEFWGCTGYPSCRHTAPIEEAKRDYKNYYRLVAEMELNKDEVDAWVHEVYLVKTKSDIADDKWKAFMAVMETNPSKIIDGIGSWRLKSDAAQASIPGMEGRDGTEEAEACL